MAYPALKLSSLNTDTVKNTENYRCKCMTTLVAPEDPLR